jgi:23S rRNA (cytosine1962-C5)-methyltransferase
VTAVDLDEGALATARANAKLNRANIRFVQDDAFQHMRNLIREGKTYEVVILDPPKLIRNRAELETGERKHLDLNRLALQIVAPGGLLLTCTCSGLLGEPEFLRLLQTAARQAGTGRTIQILQRTGAAADHPVLGDVPETEYLHAAWLRVLE